MRDNNIDDVVKRFRNYLSYQGKSERTIKYYTYHVRRFLEFVGKPVDEITREDVSDYYDYLKESGGYSNRSLNLVGWSLKAFFECFGRRDMATWVPTPSFSITYEPKWIPMDKIDDVIDDEAPLVVAYDLALRLSELFLLRRSTYNPRTGDIEVTRLKRKGRANKQILTLSPRAKDVLNRYLEGRKDNDDRIFTMSPRMVQYIFKRQLKKAGLDPSEYTFHSLRHSRATHIAIKELKEKGYVDIVSLAKFLGHSRPETTMIYVHIANKYIRFHQ